jgi:2-polyprenyl-3-methyl-5-hydroxy-6-metoxy-1,4-benzoquinol methylase
MSQNTVSHQAVEQCEICQSKEFSPVGTHDRDGKPLSSVICNSCGLVFSNPRPSSEQIDDYYREGYRISYKKAWQPRLQHTLRAGKVAAERLSYLMPLLTPGCSTIDFGSGGGELVFMLRQLGYDSQGIEPNIGYAEYSRDALDIPVQIGGFDQANVELESLDVVTLFHVAEHLEHPVAALKKAASWLRPGGRMLVEVPNVESTCIWPSSRFHQAHLYNFNTETLAQTGRRAGLELLQAYTSDDGGNVTCTFVKPEQMENAASSAMLGNAERIKNIIHKHTAWSHLFTRHPYARPLKKLLRYSAEKEALRDVADGKSLLLRLVGQMLVERPKIKKATFARMSPVYRFNL